MRKKHNKSGFTMAEMLIVVAIITVLAGVSFVAVQRHQRSMAHLECEAVAKEIFVAAQNHLTMAESQGYLGVATAPGTDINQKETEKNQGIYYLVNNGIAPTDNSLLELMLPFGSIDETVRAGGSYLIRFQLRPATVLDVFYCSQTGKYEHTISAGEYDALLAVRDSVADNGNVSSNRSARLKYGSATVGWYGGTGALPFGTYLEMPKIEIEDAERLIVKVWNYNLTNADASLKLIVKGESSDAMAAIPIHVIEEEHTAGTLSDDSKTRVKPVSNGTAEDPNYIVILDDITGEKTHFADLNNSTITTAEGIDVLGTFKPGENITVYAVAYSNTTLTNIAYSNEATTNSLFADYDAENTTAMIANFRHLENLDGAVSGIGTGTNPIAVSAAQQIEDLGALPGSETGSTETSGTGETSLPAGDTGDDEDRDLSWTGFVSAIQEAKPDDDVKVYALNDTTGTQKDSFRPVSPSYALTYSGGYDVKEGDKTVHKRHGITDVIVDGAEDAGLFGAPTGKLVVKDLILVDFNISGSGNAGALAGTLTGESEADNVLAYYSDILLDDATATGTGADSPSKTMKVSSTGGSAGGLVGSMTGGSVTDSAAALIVSSEAATGANAGGLIGAAAGVRVENSYAGGHTTNGKYKTDAITDFNVAAASGNAGGLIGAASGATDIRFSYATCSASGTVAGGLIGAADGNAVAVSHSYAVGRAAGTDAQGTLLGGGQIKVQALNESGSATDVSKTKADLDFVYAVDLDSEDLLMPKTIPTGAAAWKVRSDANPYDGALANAPVSRKYPFPTVNQLHQLNNESSYDPNAKSDFLGIHYGDWEEIRLLADVDLELLNRERLSAKITLPVAQIEEGRKITLLIHGDTTDDPKMDACLVLQVTKSTDTSATDPYVLSLSPESVVPGVESGKLTEWFDKLKKDGTGFDITGTGDDAVAAIELNLDDITRADTHFTQLFSEFKAGENICAAVKGGVVDQDKLDAIVADTTQESWAVEDADGNSHEIAGRTNSLFADPVTADDPDGTNIEGQSVSIANFRHLENLDAAVSGLDENLMIAKAVQIKNLSEDETYDGETEADLSWAGFKAAIDADNPESVAVYTSEETPAAASAGCYRPVNPTGALEYDGKYTVTEDGTTVQKSHTITGVHVNAAGDAGLFGALQAGSKVSGLELIDFNITGTTSAGALAGSMDGTSVENIKVRDSGGEGKTTAVAATSGSAGGLIGSMTGGSVSNALIYGSAATVTATVSAGGLIGSMSGATPKVEYCAAALLVNSTGGDAGGLIGAASSGSVEDSYSGGHTSGGAYTTTYNVVTTHATGNAGGLIGSAAGASVKNCYSTCSATGATAGGLVGTATGSIDNCYATGLVGGTNVGAFAGSLTGTVADCLYYEAVNLGMSATGNAVEGVPVTGVTEIDADLKAYHDFVGESDEWTRAEPYDAQLKADYPKSGEEGTYLYNLKGISRLDTAASTTDKYVFVHYGDWPVPGIQVQNTSAH